MDFSFDIEFVKNPCFILSSKINVDNFPDVNNSFIAGPRDYFSVNCSRFFVFNGHGRKT